MGAVENAEEHGQHQAFDRAPEKAQDAVKNLILVQNTEIAQLIDQLNNGSLFKSRPQTKDMTSVVFPSCESDHRHSEGMWLTEDTIPYYLSQVSTQWQQFIELFVKHAAQRASNGDPPILSSDNIPHVVNFSYL